MNTDEKSPTFKLWDESHGRFFQNVTGFFLSFGEKSHVIYDMEGGQNTQLLKKITIVLRNLRIDN